MLKIENLSREALVRLEELANSVNGQITASRISELIRKKDQEEDRKKLIIMILAVVGAIAAAAAIGYAVYRFLTPEYLDDFDDDFDDSDTTKMYCTELIVYAFKQAGADISEGRRHKVDIPIIKADCILPSDIHSSPYLRTIIMFHK